MSIHYIHSEGFSYIMTYASGYLALFEILDYLDKMIIDNIDSLPHVEIVDCSDVEDFNFGFGDVHVLICKLEERHKNQNFKGSIFISGKAQVTGMLNFVRFMAEKRQIHITIVDSMETALKEALPLFLELMQENRCSL